MASQSALRKTDIDRGIRNVTPAQERVNTLPSRTNVGDRYKGMGWNKATNDAQVAQAANDAQFAQTKNDEIAELTYIAEAQQEEAQLEELMEARMRAEQQNKLKMGLAGKVSSIGGESGRLRLLGTGLANVGSIYLLFQLPLAILSLVGFYFHAKAVEIKDTTWYGQILGKLVDFPSKFPFELIGMACWGLVFMITVGVFITYLFFFQRLKISVFSSTSSILITASCLALNIFPVTNIFPFLLIWVIYMCLLGGRK